MIWLWLLLVFVGLGIALGASRRAVQHAGALIEGTKIPPFFVGITLVAVGTDLPEIANSIVASATGHGDLNVGDSVGSAATQVTLVLGLLPLLCGAFAVHRRLIAVTGAATCFCLALGVAFVQDGVLSRLEALTLCAAWLASSTACWHARRRPVGGGAPSASSASPTSSAPSGRRAAQAAATLGYLALVGAGAAAAVHGVVAIASAFSIPEYLISFFAMSVGTSLPELIVDVTALRRGHGELAVGDVFGSSLVDSSLSIAVGPLLFPNVVDAALASRGALLAIAAVGVATAATALPRRHDRRTGLLLFAGYGALYPLLLAR